MITVKGFQFKSDEHCIGLSKKNLKKAVRKHAKKNVAKKNVKKSVRKHSRKAGKKVLHVKKNRQLKA